MSEISETSLPEDLMVILPMRNVVLFPGAVTPIMLGREMTIAGMRAAMAQNRQVGVLLQRDPGEDQPGPDDLYTMGTSAQVVRYAEEGGNHQAIVSGARRFRVREFVPGYPFLAARVEELDTPEGTGPEIEAREQYLRRKANEALELLGQTQLTSSLASVRSPSALADTIAAVLDVPASIKQDILETLDLTTRLDTVIEHVAARLQVLRLTREIADETRSRVDAQSRERMLREQMDTIRSELGDDASAESALEELRAAIEAAGMPESVREEADREFRRLERMNEQSAEYGALRTWLEVMADLPWSGLGDESTDIEHARQVLDEDHFGLDKVKRRILEFLAVRKLNPDGKSPILCLAGPPGVGKTSLGRSIARALDLEFARVSLGGLHDESEIRGHRRTYVGAMPGNVIRAMRKAGTRNPVFMLDEIDKLGAGFHGDPASAMLEVLDPEQNHEFGDNYLGIPFDLSNVLFVATANVLDDVPAPLRDRMEVIEIPGYTAEEKRAIAERYLVPRQLEASGLTEDQLTLEGGVLEAVIRDYTREAGVRNLERQIGALLRSAAVQVAADEAARPRVSEAHVNEILGAPLFQAETALHEGVAGVSTGLAWTPAGGDILFVEATLAKGNGSLILTGQLGDVMRESAQAALSLVKARAEDLGIQTDFEKSEIHIHVPAGAIPKDGPSAGVALTLALVSLLTGRPVRHDIAMTGEISLRGRVMPVGGIKDKCLAAHRAGITKVMLPSRNQRDLRDIPESAREGLTFVWLDDIEQAIHEALEPSQWGEIAMGNGEEPAVVT